MPATSDYHVHSGPDERLCNNLPQRNFSGMTMLDIYEKDLNRIEPRFAGKDSGQFRGNFKDSVQNMDVLGARRMPNKLKKKTLILTRRAGWNDLN